MSSGRRRPAASERIQPGRGPPARGLLQPPSASVTGIRTRVRSHATTSSASDGPARRSSRVKRSTPPTDPPAGPVPVPTSAARPSSPIGTPHRRAVPFPTIRHRHPEHHQHGRYGRIVASHHGEFRVHLGGLVRSPVLPGIHHGCRVPVSEVQLEPHRGHHRSCDRDSLRGQKWRRGRNGRHRAAGWPYGLARRHWRWWQWNWRGIGPMRISAAHALPRCAPFFLPQSAGRPGIRLPAEDCSPTTRTSVSV